MAWTDQGVSAVDVGMDADAFGAAYLARTGRDLTWEARPPAEVARALATCDGAGVAVDLIGLTPFARSVLAQVASIPRGETRSYGWIAERLGNPRAVRAVGTAVGHNPVPIIVPCHRVVRSDGLGMFSMGGPDAKRKLLTEEGGPA